MTTKTLQSLIRTLRAADSYITSPTIRRGITDDATIPRSKRTDAEMRCRFNLAIIGMPHGWQGQVVNEDGEPIWSGDTRDLEEDAIHDAQRARDYLIEAMCEEPDRSCGLCQGTGIGQHGDPDTSRCSACGGSGEVSEIRMDSEDMFGGGLGLGKRY